LLFGIPSYSLDREASAILSADCSVWLACIVVANISRCFSFFNTFDTAMSVDVGLFRNCKDFLYVSKLCGQKLRWWYYD